MPEKTEKLKICLDFKGYMMPQGCSDPGDGVAATLWKGNSERKSCRNFSPQLQALWVWVMYSKAKTGQFQPSVTARGKGRGI